MKTAEERVREILKERYPDKGEVEVKIVSESPDGYGVQVAFEDGSIGDETVSKSEI